MKTSLSTIGSRILSVTALLFAVQTTHAAIKYVATNGQDSWPGTEAQPYRTIAKGLQNIGGGGTLNIKAGTYAERIRNNAIPTGTQAAPTIVQNYGSDVVTIEPAFVSGDPGIVRIDNTSWVILRGLIFDAEFCLGGPIQLGISQGHPNYTTAQNIRIENSTIRNGTGSGGIATYPGSDNNIFSNLKLHDNGRTTEQYGHGLYLSSSHNLVEKCEVYGSSSMGIQVYWLYGSDGGANASNNTIRNNRFYNNSVGPNEDSPGIGIFTGTNNMVYNNLVWGNGFGILVRYSAANTGIYNNTVYDNEGGGPFGGHGIWIWDSVGTGTVVRNNISYGHSVSNWNNDALVAVTASNNLFSWASPASDGKFQSLVSTNGNFLKLSSSATDAIDAGMTVALVTNDYWLEPRTGPGTGSAYDIGADEVFSPVPSAPSGLTATAVSSSQINLAWTDNASNETGFMVERKTGAGGTYGQIATPGAVGGVGGTGTYNNNSGLSPGTNYYYRVRSYNASGNSTYSNEANATTQGAGATLFVTGQTLSTSQWNNYTGWKGMKITVGTSPISVTELGRWVIAGNTGAHTVKLVTSTGGAVSGGSVSVTTSGATAGQFKYVALAAPVTLSANTVYYLVSQETNGGDFWWGYTTILSHTSAATVNNAVTSSDSVTFTNDGTTNNCAVPLGFKYNAITTFVTGQTLSTSQWNNYTGWKGMKITVGASPISVTELGRWVIAGNTGAHTVKLVTSTGGAVTGGSVSVATSGAAAGQFKHVALAAPVTLSANTVYYLVSQETNGGDFWWGYTTILSHTSAAAVNNAVTSADSVTFINDGTTNNCAVPLSFKYY